MSLDDFLALGETNGKWELDDGVLYVVPFSGSKDHQFLVHQFCRYIEDYRHTSESLVGELHHQITTILSPRLHRAMEPDIVVILAGPTDIGGVVHVEGIPDIVVEILSSDRSRYLVQKRQIYAESGVQEYWIIDPAADTVSLLALRDGEIHPASHPGHRRYVVHAFAARPRNSPGSDIPAPSPPGPGGMTTRRPRCSYHRACWKMPSFPHLNRHSCEGRNP